VMAGNQAGSSSQFLRTFRLPSSSPPTGFRTRFSPPALLINPVLANIEFQKLSTSALSFPYFHIISTFPSEKSSEIRKGVSNCSVGWPSFAFRLAALDHVFPGIVRSDLALFGVLILMELRYGIIRSWSSVVVWGGFGTWVQVCAEGRRAVLISPERNLSC